MKKPLILLFSILISFNSYGEAELDFSSDTFCEESPKVQVRKNLFFQKRFYLPNQEKPYSGNNLCIYLSNGQYYNQGKIKNGLRDGKWTYWHENGQLSQERNYKDGNLVGQTNYYYYENAQIRREENWKYPETVGKKDGKWTWWYLNGQIQQKGNYKDGDQDGKWTYWHENGQLSQERNYKDGVCVSGDCP